MDINSSIAGVGYVRSVFSRRANAQAVPVDLLRVVCGLAGRAARTKLQEAGLDPFVVGGIDPAGWRERVGAEFDGYLVTDGNPSDMSAAEMAACWPFGEFKGFSGRRWMYENDRPSIYRTGWGPSPSSMQPWAVFAADGACLDAAWWIAAGSVCVRKGASEGMPSSVVRGES